MKTIPVRVIPFLLLSILGFVSGAASQPQEDLSEEYALVEIKEMGRANYTELYAKNLTAADVTITFGAELTNAYSVMNLPLTVTIAPYAATRVTSIAPISTEEKWKYSYVYLAAFGDPKAQHDDGYLYRLPYPAGKQHRVVQSFGGEFTHKNESHYAVDFKMPIGSEVCAAREGLVIEVKESSNVGGTERKMRKEGNHILVRHADRTIATYAHFQQDGISVAVGDSVARGQVIGYSGNTGYSSGPHLHFSVHTLTGSDGESCAILFDSTEGTLDHPVEGHVYLARD